MIHAGRGPRTELEDVIAELCDSVQLAWQCEEIPYEYGSERGWRKLRRASLADPALAYLEYAGVYDALPVHPLRGEKEGVPLKFTFCRAPAGPEPRQAALAVYRVEIDE